MTKKGPNIKLGPQGEKKGLGQDPRKDSSMDSGHHVKVQILPFRNTAVYYNIHSGRIYSSTELDCISLS